MTSLKVVSWNIWGGQKLPEIIEQLKAMQPDVIGLQEVLQDEAGGNNNAKDIAEALGYSYIYETTTLLIPSISKLLEEHHIEKNMEWGNAIVSKYPIQSHAVHVLSQDRKRTAIEAVISVHGTELHVISTHLVYAPEDASELHTHQIQSLLKIVPTERGIVMGDFNADPKTESIQSIGTILIDSNQGSTEPTSGTDRLDYIFHTNDLKATESGVTPSGASDHSPIYAVIEF